MNESRTEHVDAVVVGAGPAGSAAATVLAEGGRRVALLDKSAGSRYHVGESLIPFCWFPLDRLGLVDSVAGSGFVVQKNSVQFVGIEGSVSKPFYFFEHTDHPSARTWQVEREAFDRLLLERAREVGATFHGRTTAKALLRRSAEDPTVVGVRALDAEGREVEFRAPLTVDASGRDGFGQVQNGWRIKDRKLKKHTIWTYYEGAVRDSGVDEGTTTIAYLPEKGWFWFIPLPRDRVSVGVVAEKAYLYRDGSSPEEIFEREVQVQQWIKARLAPARRVEDFRATNDFSYRSLHCAQDGLVLAGDAFSFLDPVFSSGVYFALYSGVRAGEAGLAALEAGDLTAARFAPYAEDFLRQMEPMRRLVHAFYELDFNFGAFLKRYPEFRSDLTDCLIGDLDRDFEPFFRAVGEFVPLPEPLPHGRPQPRSPDAPSVPS